MRCGSVACAAAGTSGKAAWQAAAAPPLLLLLLLLLSWQPHWHLYPPVSLLLARAVTQKHDAKVSTSKGMEGSTYQAMRCHKVVHPYPYLQLQLPFFHLSASCLHDGMGVREPSGEVY